MVSALGASGFDAFSFLFFMKITVERTPIAAARIAITTTRPTTSGTLSLVPVEPGTGVGVFVGSDVGVGGIVGVGVST